MIVFVGDKPSKHNIDPAIPFVGTKSYKTLLSWIYEMDIDISEVKLVNACDLNLWIYRKDKHVALGEIAKKKLDSYGIKYFKLPHPSGLNFALNNKVWLKEQLEACKEWLK